MLLKIYLALWTLFALAVGVVAVTGNLTQLATVIFGFVSMPLIFMGMIIILPGQLMHATDKVEVQEKPPLKTRLKQFAERKKNEWTITDMAARNFSERY